MSPTRRCSPPSRAMSSCSGFAAAPAGDGEGGFTGATSPQPLRASAPFSAGMSPEGQGAEGHQPPAGTSPTGGGAARALAPRGGSAAPRSGVASLPTPDGVVPTAGHGPTGAPSGVVPAEDHGPTGAPSERGRRRRLEPRRPLRPPAKALQVASQGQPRSSRGGLVEDPRHDGRGVQAGGRAQRAAGSAVPATAASTPLLPAPVASQEQPSGRREGPS